MWRIAKRMVPLALSGLIAVLATSAEAAAQGSRADVVVGPVPGGRLADSLLALAAEARTNIAFDAALIGDRRTPSLNGKLPLREALDRLLAGSGLTYAFTASGVVVRPAPPPPPPRPVPPPPPPPAGIVEPPTVTDTLVVVGYRSGLDRAEARARRYEGLVEIVSADAVGKLPDTNIADALDRLPSVYRISDQGEGRYLSLRGLSQVLDTVTFNGVTIAASDTDGRSGRAAPLDVLSASAVSEVEIHSVITPDRDSGAIGGLINVRTPTAHDFPGRMGALTAEIGGADAGGGRDIHAVRAAFADTFGPGGAFGVYLAGERWVREYFSPFYDNAEVAAAASGVAGLYPDRILMGASVGRRERTSLTAALDWKGEGGSAAWLQVLAADYNDEEMRPEFMLYRIGDLVAPRADAFSWPGIRARTETRQERQERPVRQYVLGGRLALSEAWTLEASANRTTAKELNPYLNYYETLGDILPAGRNVGAFRLADGLALADGPLVAPNGASVYDGGFQRLFRVRRITSAVSEAVDAQQVDLTRRGDWGDRPFSVQLGLKHLARAKSVEDADNRFNFLGAATLADPALAGGFAAYGGRRASDVVAGLDFPFVEPRGAEALFEARPDLFMFDAVSSRANSVEDDYRIRETIWAGYLMGTLEVTPALRVTLGARLEHTDVQARANAFVATVSGGGSPFAQGDILPTAGGRSYANLSPALLAKWDAGGAWVLRASLTHTFARPDYVDLAPISTLAVTAAGPVLSAVNEMGNPGLRPIRSRNWDASAQYHLPRGLGWISVAGFYKSLDGLPFESAAEAADVVFAGVRFDRYTLITRTNSGHGHVAGVEVSARYDFLDLPAPLDGFGVLANAAFLDSRVSAPGISPRRLADQADLLYTAQLYYERDGFEARLAYAYQGLAPRSDQWTDPTELNWRRPQSRLDLKVAVDLARDWRVTFAGANLTDYAHRSERSTEPYLLSSYETYGREYRLSLTRRW